MFKGFYYFCAAKLDIFMSKRPLILVSNDDGVYSQGLRELTGLMCALGDVVVVAPDAARSGSACSITSTKPVFLKLQSKKTDLAVYVCSGTPVDCVKLALEKVVPRKPDLMVSGINHGDNASVSLHYSGTMGAVLEACMKGVPAIGYSLRTRDKQCDFAPYREAVLSVAGFVLAEGLPHDVCVNVNFPMLPALKGQKVCRMARGAWLSEWREDGENAYRLTGTFTNLEPEAEDTDYWALDHGYASITPLQLDMTCTPSLLSMKSLQCQY